VLIGGMNNVRSPYGHKGFVATDVQNLEFWPFGSCSRRRGFQPFLSSTPGAGALNDLFVYDHYIGTTRTIDLVSRTGKGGIIRNNIYSGSASTANAWAGIHASVWATSSVAGQFFARENILYGSDGGQRTAGWFRGTAASNFTLGLTTPAGTPAYGLSLAVAGRQEPGYYDWGFTAYHDQRNVESLPSFHNPATLHYGATGGLVTYHTLGGVPDLPASMQINWAAMTFDSAKTHVNIYRRHPMDLDRKPANRIDNARLVASTSMTAGTFADLFNDHELGARLTFAGSPPEPWIAAAEFKGRHFYVYSTHPWRIYFSEVDAPEMVAKNVTIEGMAKTPILLVDGNDTAFMGEAWIGLRRRSAGPIRALLPVGDRLLILCENQTWQLTGSGPTDWRLDCLNEHLGCIAPRTAISTRYGAFWFSQQGLVWWTGGKPEVCSDQCLDFDDSRSPVRWQRSILKNALAAYDPDRAQMEFALPGYGQKGNTFILTLHCALSTSDQPQFTWHSPNLASGEFITGMVTLDTPDAGVRVLYGTNKGRVLYRNASTDHNNSAQVAFPVALAGWLGQEDDKLAKGNLGLKFVHKADHVVSIGSSVWPCETARRPDAGKVATDEDVIVGSTNSYGATTLSARGNLFYLRFSETASSPLELQDIQVAGQKGADWVHRG